MGAKAPTPPPVTAPTVRPPDLKINGKPKVIILDTPGNPFATAMRDALTPLAGPVEIVPAERFVAAIEAEAPTKAYHLRKITAEGYSSACVAIIGAQALPPGAGPALRRFADRGQAVWYQATTPVVPPDARELLLHAPVFGRHWVELDSPKLALTEEGQRVWSNLPAELPATKCSFIPLNDSIYYDTNPCTTTLRPLLTCRYPGRNWVSLPDSFTGGVGVLLDLNRGGGGRILMIGQGGDPSSPFSSASPVFAETSRRTLAALMGLYYVSGEAGFGGDDRPAVERSQLLKHDVPLLGTIEFSRIPLDDDEYFDLHRQIGFNAMLCGIQWLREPDANGDVADFAYLDGLMAKAKLHKVRVVLDPYAFDWASYGWAGRMLDEKGGFVDSPNIHDPASERFVQVMRKIGARYHDDPTLCAMMATPHTGTSTVKVDASPVGRAAWAAYLKAKGLDLAAIGRRYGRPAESWDKLPLPDLGAGEGLDCSALRADYYDFYTQAYYTFMDKVIRGIRAEAPDLPLLLRGGWWDVAVNCELASRYPQVAPHCECVETSSGIDAIYRGYALNFGIPVSGENGWPKERGGPLRQAMGDILMGNFDTWLYSFAGPRYARPSADDFGQFAFAWQKVAKSQPLPAKLGLLISDTTLYASRPPSFMSVQGRPHLHDVMERLDFPFQAVSAHFPRVAGLTVIVDDGVNEVLTPATRDRLAAWVRAGGTLIGTPITGSRMFDGSAPSLYEMLGVAPKVGEKATQEFPVGNGRVILLPSLAEIADANVAGDMLDTLFTRLLGEPPVRVTPRVNHCVRRAGDKLYVIAYNKSDDYIGAFFQESRLADAERALPNQTLHIKARGQVGQTYGNWNGAQGQATRVSADEVRCRLPRTRWTVVEITVPGGR